MYAEQAEKPEGAAAQPAEEAGKHDDVVDAEFEEVKDNK
jgi:molecular chaperone DnaK